MQAPGGWAETDVLQPVLLHDAFEKWLGLLPWFVDVVAGTVIANRMPGPAVRLALVGDSGIEEVIESLSDPQNIVHLNSHTADQLEGRLERMKSGWLGQHEESDTEQPFLLLRAPNLPIKEAMDDQSAMRRELKNAMSVVDSIQVPSDVPTSKDVRQWLAQLAVFVTRLRTPVPRDPKTREVTDFPAVVVAAW